MKKFAFAVICLSCACAFAAPGTIDQTLLRRSIEGFERRWKEYDNPRPSMGCRELFEYALMLCEAKAHPERLDKLFTLAGQMQDRDPASKGYGNFRWYWRTDKVTDFNAVDFCMQGAGLIWLRHRDELPEPARAKLKELLDLGAQGCMRHRVRENYTNITLLNAQDLIIVGEAIGRADVANEGYSRLEQQLLYIYDYGIHEYDSPTYYGVDIDALGLIEAFAKRPSGQQQARALLELFWTDLALNFYPPAGKLGGTQSRTYDYLHGLGSLDQHLVMAGWVPAENVGFSIYGQLVSYRPAKSLWELSQNRFPRSVRQTWGESDVERKTQYLCKDVALGSSAATYHNMDMPLTADFPGDRKDVRCYFIADGRHDPYGKIKIPEGKGPHEKTLHLKPFFSAAQEQADVAAIVVYRESDVPAGTTSLESHWVMPQGNARFYIGDKPVDLSGKKPVSHAVALGEPVVLRRGTAAVGVKVIWARTVDGGAAPVSLSYDGNSYGAVRLTVDHRAGAAISKASPPAAALVVRIGSNLASDAAFVEWRNRFATASAEAQVRDSSIGIKATASEKHDIGLAVDAPYQEARDFKPALTQNLIELDGQDIGRPLLMKVEQVKSARAFGNQNLIDVATASTQWDAWKITSLSSPMVIAADPGASGGKFLWTPGEDGNGAAVGTGSATWDLRIGHAGKYYLWGRVISPTPANDSFHIRLYARGKDILPQTDWNLGVHKTWTWTRLTPAGNLKIPLELNLPEGAVKLQLRTREAGARIDRFFLTTDASASP